MSRHVLMVLVPQVTCKDNGTCLSSVGWSGSDAHLLQTRAFVAIAFQVSCHALCAIRNPVVSVLQGWLLTRMLP